MSEKRMVGIRYVVLEKLYTNHMGDATESVFYKLFGEIVVWNAILYTWNVLGIRFESYLCNFQEI